MTTFDPASVPRTADLDNPLYYLENMETVVRWVLDHHGDLLTGPEFRLLETFLGLETGEKALLTRLVMRTGELFRADKLAYPELDSPVSEILHRLVSADWVETEPLLDLDQLFRLFTLAELRPAFADTLKGLGHNRGLPKAAMKRVLSDHFSEARTLDQWFDTGDARVVRLQHMALFDRVRLMFFGNLRQTWSDFVLVELGYQAYEQVPINRESRAFDCRSDVDCYLAMQACRDQLDQEVPASEVWPQVPGPVTNAWLAGRRDRLLLELGRQAERQGDRELALTALAGSGHREARLKQLRLLERMKRHREAWQIASQWQTGELSDAERQGLDRILKRLAPKVGEPRPALATARPINEWQVSLPRPSAGSVEWAAAEHLNQPQAPVAYVENTLINGLFGLLCWPVIFKPVPGAFFHPFHTGPADLTREDFVVRRRSDFEACFAALRDGCYRERILDTWHGKQGLANPFVVWPALSEALIELALDCIPPDHLEAMFRRLLLNVKEHRSGFPDLIQFHPKGSGDKPGYEMVEVKGPGDRLQDHQRRWLDFFAREGIPASVCYVRWQENTGEEMP
ncbi:VRR-NUC domain-containing protein [Marinobacter pelagius]|uniref:VRR-NUC domain-containing protein n=1 Tax=Marinobacter sp. C7 TaxID=2951363 RepID=UPI001EF08F9C|nr:VRR-NUC domain-containing protein [Marinobacter sp. C7]MCG7200335.1 VRR-NUC domain-containing protein [Marinobacter sp. C7]